MESGKERVLIIFVVVALVLTVTFITFYRRENVTSVDELSIGIATWAGFGTGMVGMEKGFFGDIDVKTKVLDDSTARHSAFVSGDIDIMISSVDLYAQEAAQKITGQVFFVSDESRGGWHRYQGFDQDNRRP